MVNDIIEEINKQHIIEDMVDNMKVAVDDIQDLQQEIYLILLTYDEKKLREIHEKKQLKFFINRIITNNYYSVSSPYYTKYKKYYDHWDKNKDPNHLEE